MADCIFCKIINSEIPSVKFYEDNDFIAILDAFPLNDGHALVIPKAHHQDISSLPAELSSKLLVVGQKVQNLILNSSISSEGTNILINQGAVAGQTVFHVHMHILPRNPKDEIYFHHKKTEFKPIDELQIVAEKIVHK